MARNRISPEELKRRQSMLERQKDSQASGAQFTDSMAADQLGMKLATWRAWKRIQDQPAAAKRKKQHQPATNGNRAQKLAMELAGLSAQFEEGQRAVEALRKIKKIIDEALA